MTSNMRLVHLADLKLFKTGWKVQVNVLHTWKKYQTKTTVKKNLLHRFERMMVVGEWNLIENFALNQASDVIGRVESVRELKTIPVMYKDTSKLEFDLCNKNSFQTSKVLIDLNDPDVIDFKNSLPANGGNITFLSSKPHQRISYDDESNFDQFPMVVIAELKDYLEVGKCKIMCTLYAVDTDWSWFYLKENLYGGSNTYKVGKVWKGNQVLTTTFDEVNESEDEGDQSLLISGNQASLMNTHSQESLDDVFGNIKNPLLKRERDNPKDSIDSSLSSKKSFNSVSSVETTYANEVIDENTLKSDDVLVNVLLTSESNEGVAKGRTRGRGGGKAVGK
ncbi:uncharacterized protein LOC18014761 [Eutrema salsugineum]|uniref:uncharacterized protein LOC18014761 n=1 Tax=Eutrema salsugineum TaxID=72664 RepID=UPI000CED2D48|nr:uncharacterized protein LOC18014761 [Eutrema salsugineum]